MKTSTMLFAGLLLATSATAQSGSHDQSSPQMNAALNIQNGQVWQQEVEAGQSGILEGYYIYIQNSFWGATLETRVYNGSGPHSGTPAFEKIMTISTSAAGNYDAYYIDCESAGLNFAAGDIYTIEVTGSAGSSMLLDGSNNTPKLYPETLWLNGSDFITDDLSMAFDTYVVPGPFLEATNMIAGSTGNVSVYGATANGLVYSAYSLRGPGPATTSFGLAFLTMPIELLTPATANASGTASISTAIPPVAAGVSVWMQALDMTSGKMTNGVNFMIQ